MSSVDTSYPVLAASMIEMQIVEAKVEPGKKNPDSQILVIVLATLAENPDHKGGVVPAGYKLTHRIGLTETDKYTKDMLLKNLAVLQDAALGQRIPLDQFDTDILLDKNMTVKTKVVAATDEFPEKSEVARLIPKAPQSA